MHYLLFLRHGRKIRNPDLPLISSGEKIWMWKGKKGNGDREKGEAATEDKGNNKGGETGGP